MREGTEREETRRGRWGSEGERGWGVVREEEYTGRNKVNWRAGDEKVRGNGGQNRGV